MEKDMYKCRVVYQGEDGGYHTYQGTKIVFQHRDSVEGLKEGLAVEEKGTYRDFGTYAFADFKNIKTVEPDRYRELSFYNWKGIPQQIYKGTYGESVIFKEVYSNGEYIRAYTKDGEALLYERNMISKEEYQGINMYYTRINDVVYNWEDITESVHKCILQEIKERKTEVDITHRDVVNSLDNLYTNGVRRLKSGVIVGEGKHEHMVLWTMEDGSIGTAWTSILRDIEEIEQEDITIEVRKVILEARK